MVISCLSCYSRVGRGISLNRYQQTNERKRERVATTQKDLDQLIEVLAKLYAPLLEGEINEDTYESNKRPHLVLQIGSKTYGRAYRINLTGGTKYGSGHWEPRHFSDYLGMTRAEAETKLRGIIAGIHTGLAIAEKAGK